MEATAAEAGRCTLPHTISYAEGSFSERVGGRVNDQSRRPSPDNRPQERNIFESHASPKRTGTRAPFFVSSSGSRSPTRKMIRANLHTTAPVTEVEFIETSSLLPLKEQDEEGGDASPPAKAGRIQGRRCCSRFDRWQQKPFELRPLKADQNKKKTKYSRHVESGEASYKRIPFTAVRLFFESKRISQLNEAINFLCIQQKCQGTSNDPKWRIY